MTSEAETAKKNSKARLPGCRGPSKLEKVSSELSSKQAEIENTPRSYLEGMTIDQVKTKLKELGDQNGITRSGEKILVDKLSPSRKLTSRNSKRKEKEGQRTDAAGLTHILAVNPDWNFVVLDIGANQGVVEEATMIVYREGAPGRQN